MDSYFGDGADNNNIGWGIVYRCDDATLNVNSTQEGTFASGSTIDIEITDGTDPVTPDAVIVTGNTVEIQVPPASTPVGATLMKTGQTTSYRTGDDGDLEAGRATNFTTLAVNNPFGNTNRFTDELGGQTYTNNWVIDWSTYDSIGGTVLGYYRIAQAAVTWNNAIDGALGTFGTFAGCRLPNVNEIQNIVNFQNAFTSGAFNYAPFNVADTIFWTSNTLNGSSTNKFYTFNFGFGINFQDLSNSSKYIPVRTFTVSGTTLS